MDETIVILTSVRFPFSRLFRDHVKTERIKYLISGEASSIGISTYITIIESHNIQARSLKILGFRQRLRLGLLPTFTLMTHRHPKRTRRHKRVAPDFPDAIPRPLLRVMKDTTTTHARYIARDFQINLVLRHAVAEEHPDGEVEGGFGGGLRWFAAADGEALELKAGDEGFVYAASGKEGELLVAWDG